MSDNTQLNVGVSGDRIRDLDRQGGGIKTQTVQLDLGGASANAENLITAGQQTMANSVPVVIASNQTAVPVSGTFWQSTQPVSFTPPTLTKGTQGSTGYSTQDLKDAGRVFKSFSANNFSATATEGLITLTPIADGVAGSTGTSFTVTSAKRLRIQSIAVSAQAPTSTSISALFRLRVTSTGAITTSSPLIANLGVGVSGTLLALGTDSSNVTFPDGLELSGSMQFGMTQLGSASSGFYVSIVGYEY